MLGVGGEMGLGVVLIHLGFAILSHADCGFAWFRRF